MPFPLIKLGSLAIKQLSKPLSKFIKNRAVQSNIFKRYICMPPAQLYHWLDIHFRMRLAGLGKARDVKPLTDAMAVELGAELLGESIIFTMAAGTIYLEYARSARKDASKEQKQNDHLASLQNKVNDQGLLLAEQDAKLRELERNVLAMSGSKIKS